MDVFGESVNLNEITFYLIIEKCCSQLFDDLKKLVLLHETIAFTFADAQHCRKREAAEIWTNPQININLLTFSIKSLY